MVWVRVCCIKCTNVCFGSQPMSWALILFVLQRLPYCHTTHRITMESRLTLFNMNTDASQRSTGKKRRRRKKTPRNHSASISPFENNTFLYTVYISTFIYIDFLIDLVFFSSFSASCWLKKGKKTKKQEPLLNLIRLNTFFPLFSFILFFFWTETQNSERIRDNVSLKKKREKEESFLHIQTHICTEDYSGSRTSQYS